MVLPEKIYAQKYTRTPLLEILDPPLVYHINFYWLLSHRLEMCQDYPNIQKF